MKITRPTDTTRAHKARTSSQGAQSARASELQNSAATPPHDEPTADAGHVTSSGEPLPGDSSDVSRTRSTQLNAASASTLPLPITTRKARRKVGTKFAFFSGAFAGAALLGAGLGIKAALDGQHLTVVQHLFDSSQASLAIQNSSVADLRSFTSRQNSTISDLKTTSAAQNSTIMKLRAGEMAEKNSSSQLIANLQDRVAKQQDLISQLRHTISTIPITLNDRFEASVQPSQDAEDFAIGQWRYLALDPNPYDFPLARDVNEHGVGDCVGDAVLASLAFRAPFAIQRIITDNKDGTYAIKMYDPNNVAFEMQIDGKFLTDDAGGMIQTGSLDYQPNWSSLLVKAIAKYNSIYQTGPTDDFRLGGINAEQVLTPLLGPQKITSVGPGQYDEEQVRDFFAAAEASGAFIVGGIHVDNEAAADQPQDTFVQLHGYSIFGLATLDGNQSYVAVRNPWGVAPTSDNSGYDTSNEGLDLVPLSEFVATWDYTSFVPQNAIHIDDKQQLLNMSVQSLQTLVGDVEPVLHLYTDANSFQKFTDTHATITQAIVSKNYNDFRAASKPFLAAYEVCANAVASSSPYGASAWFTTVMASARASIDAIALQIAVASR